MERKQVIRDSEGNEETIVSKEIGDKRYVVTTKKDKNGVETKSEDLFNMNESKYISKIIFFCSQTRLNICKDLYYT